MCSPRRARPTRTITSARLRPTTNQPPIRTRRLTGVTRRSSRKACAWKRKEIAPARLRLFIKLWTTRQGRISAANCSGITKQDLMLLDYWRRIQNGNLPLRSMISSLRPEAVEAKKRKRASTICAWNIFSGRTEAFPAQAGGSGLAQKYEVDRGISLLKFAAGAKSRHGKWNQTESRVRLVGPNCNRDLRPCILRISIR